MRLRLSVLCLGATLSFARVGWAQAPVDEGTRSSARQLGEEAQGLFDAGDYAGALDRYNRADALVHVPTLGVRAARCLVKLGRLVEAAERYLAVTRLELAPDALAVHRTAKEDAERERGELLPRIPSVVITLPGSAAGAIVTLDGRPVPEALLGVKRNVDPGVHTVVVKRGDAQVSRPFTAREGEVVPLSIDLAATVPPATEPPPHPPAAAPVDAPAAPAGSFGVQRALGFAAIGVGGAGLALGAITGGIVGAQHASLVSSGECTATLDCAGHAGSTAWNDAASYDRLRIVSTAGLIAGGALAATGLVLVLTAPPRPRADHGSGGHAQKRAASAPAIAPWLGAGAAGLAGSF